MEENAPLNQMAIEFGAFGKSFVQLIKELKKEKLEPMDATAAALDLVFAYLNYSNAKKFADNITELSFTSEEQ